ncbi:hypothetical protein [Comamonas sediminis]|uniref:Uncharacterized protein n=1 Tax=Comamonas sediminis TaxID=1783360 RepID=A0ABV4B1X4_9BURK
MTRIDPSALIQALRHSSSQSEKSASIPSTAQPSGKPETLGTVQVKSPQQQMLQRVQSIAADDPERRQKAFRFFMEYVLLEKFGRALELAPEFPHLVDQILAQMDGDPELAHASRSAADALIVQARL